jgi:cation:H+ antiporter
MSPGVAAVVFVLGAGVSLSSSWLVVSRLARWGERWGLSEALLGLVAALAADAPEVTAAITALVHGQRQVGAGVAIGSNVFNLAALLGLGALVAGRIGLHRHAVVLEGMVAGWLALTTVVVMVGVLPAPVGLAMAAVAVTMYVVLLTGRDRALPRFAGPRLARWVSLAVTEEEVELREGRRPAPARRGDAAGVLIGLVLVVGSSVAMERGGSSLGQHFGLRAAVVGGLLLAAVTSLPNAVSAVYLARRGRGAAVLSTATNSNMVNVLAGLLLPGSLAGLGPLSVHTSLSAAWYAALTAVAFGLAYRQRGLGRPAGAAIIVGYAGFVVALVAG